MAKKNYNTKNNTSRPKIPDLKPRMILFLCGFVLFTVIGSFLRGPVDPPDYVSDKYIFWILRDVRTFCFEGVARFLGRAVGLPVTGAAGRLFTLVSSLFYLVMSLSLYGAYSGTEMADFGDEPETGVARTVHFIASYPYLARVTYIIIDPKFGDTGRLNPGYNTFILLLFVIALPASLYNRSDDETPVRQKYAARWLSSFGVMLGCAGLGRLIADSALAPKVYAPGLAWSVITPIAEAVPASLAGMGKIFLTFAVLIALVALFGSILLKEKNCHMPFSIVSFALLVGGGLMFYAVRGTDGVEPRAAATWVLMLFAAAVWAMAAPKKKFLVLVSGVGVLFSGTALVTAIRLMRMPFYAAVDALRLELQPLQERALDWLSGIIPHEIIGPILALIVCLLAAFLLAIPLMLSKRATKLFVLPLDRAKYLYFAAVVLFFMESTHEIFRGIAYILLLLALAGGAAMLAAALAYGKIRAVLAIVYTAAYTVLLTVPFALFAVQFAWIIFGIIIALNFIGMANAAMHAGYDGEAQKRAAHAQASNAIHEAVMAGGNSHELSLMQTSLNSVFGIERSIFDSF